MTQAYLCRERNSMSDDFDPFVIPMEEPPQEEIGADELSIGDTIDRYVYLKNEYDDLNSRVKEMKGTLDSWSKVVLNKMTEAGVASTGTDKARVVKKTELYGNIQDMQAFVQFCADNGRADMIQKRVGLAAYREWVDQNGAYPDGTDAYFQDSVTITRKKGK